MQETSVKNLLVAKNLDKGRSVVSYKGCVKHIGIFRGQIYMKIFTISR